MAAPFRITGRIRRAPAPATRLSVREAACRACEWFHSAQQKCIHPNTARWARCWSCLSRDRPWLQPGGRDDCPLGAKAPTMDGAPAGG